MKTDDQSVPTNALRESTPSKSDVRIQKAPIESRRSPLRESTPSKTADAGKYETDPSSRLLGVVLVGGIINVAQPRDNHQVNR